jgi:TPP-dependent pyruvate/acetoin dehydrogenase alpha subunit
MTYFVMELHVKVHMKLQHGNAVEITSSFIVENNGYAMGTSVERTANHTDLETRFRLRDAMRTS